MRRRDDRANLMVVCGPQAIGKMTVAEHLRDKLKPMPEDIQALIGVQKGKLKW